MSCQDFLLSWWKKILAVKHQDTHQLKKTVFSEILTEFLGYIAARVYWFGYKWTNPQKKYERRKDWVSLWKFILKRFHVWQTLDPLRTTDPLQNVWWVLLFAFVILHSTDILPQNKEQGGTIPSSYFSSEAINRFIWECVYVVHL